MAQLRLPAEMILDIIECLIPYEPPVVFSQDHIVTRTLLSLTLVCRLVSRSARQLLVKHGLYLNSARQLNHLLQGGLLSSTGNGPAQIPSPLGLFLSPFPEDNLDIPPTVSQVDCLSSLVCEHLTRLVIDMPLRWLYPEDDHHQVRPVLRAAFARMTKLEQFCSVRDELYLSTVQGRQEPAIWSFWPRLECLALYNVDVASPQFLDGLRRCSNLTHLVLVRPDGLAEEIPPDQIGLDFLPSLQRLLVVNTTEGFLQNTYFNQRKWEQSFVGRFHALRSTGDLEGGDSDSESGSIASYLALRIPFGRDDDDIEICQEWLSAQATSGELWGQSDLRSLVYN
ncbi:hypothetical protein ARAM_007118 [Aspergillus rambellii]|uniref:F-box domain-containing protein n=1 Tax=Aspergillus rambellii TaxID=308745 RepID=A0A0F8U0P1_9EURO|nr:hypothetical protein ARAM_007118 [Aspergillus rambellii]